MSKEQVFFGGADGFMPDGTPIYFRTRSAPPSTLQLSIYAALADPSKPMSEEVKSWLDKLEKSR